MRRRPAPAATAVRDAPGPFVARDWLPLVAEDVEPMLRRVRARRLWDASWADWGGRHGYAPDAPYATAEGRRWHLFRHGPPGG